MPNPPRKKIAKPKAPAVPAIFPREPLTKKAKAAILAYVIDRCKGQVLVITGVTYTLQAERMRRAALYEWLHERGYVWLPRYGVWQKTASADNKTKTA